MIECYIDHLKKEVQQFVEKIDYQALDEAKEMIITARMNHGRVHVTGIGKPGHVSHYLASLLSSTGTPAYFLDATEAIHGSAGQVLPEDVVIAISNSGETEELKKAMHTVKNLGVQTIGVAGNPSCWLAESTDIFLYAGVNHEGDTLNKPPRLSILAEMIILQCLTILLQDEQGLDAKAYYKWHPGGALGASIQEAIGGQR